MGTGAGTSGRDGGLNLQSAVALLPTPTAQSYGTNQGGAAGRTGQVRESLSTMARNDRDWGKYQPAIERWEVIREVAAPEPTSINPKSGKPTLNPAFPEWMMGLQPGWVTDVPKLSKGPNGHRGASLSLIGDGVVPQQATESFSLLINAVTKECK